MKLKSFAIKTDKQNLNKDLGEAMGAIIEQQQTEAEIVEEIDYGHYKSLEK